MKKKGQATMFIIVGIIVVAIIVLVLTLRFFSQPSQTAPIIIEGTEGAAQLESCLEEAGGEAVYLLGKKGGYTDLNRSEGRAYYIDNGQILVPSLEDMASEIKNYVDANLGGCVEEFPPVSVSVQDKVIVASGGVSADFEVRLKLINELSMRIVEESKDEICLECLLEIDEVGIFMDVYEISEDENVVRMTDLGSDLTEGGYEFSFGLKYA